MSSHPALRKACSGVYNYVHFPPQEAKDFTLPHLPTSYVKEWVEWVFFSKQKKDPLHRQCEHYWAKNSDYAIKISWQENILLYTNANSELEVQRYKKHAYYEVGFKRPADTEFNFLRVRNQEEAILMVELMIQNSLIPKEVSNV